LRSQLGLLRAKLAMRFPAICIVNSIKAHHDIQADQSAWTPRQRFFVPNPFDLESYPAAARRPTEMPYAMLAIGRLTTQKNWPRLITIMKKFSARVTFPWRLRICGIGPLRQELEALVHQSGLTAQIEFLGFREDIPALIASAHVVVLSSDYEGTPNVVLEAMACQRPVIATAVGDVPYLITDEREGYVVPVEDTEIFVERLIHLATHRELGQRMGAAARARIEREFSRAVSLNATLDVYRQAGWHNEKRKMKGENV